MKMMKKNTFGKIVCSGKYKAASDFRFDISYKVICSVTLKIYPERESEIPEESM